jgi:translation initiation factor IF-2
MGENGQKTIELPAMITVRELALAIQVSPIEIIKILMNNGVMANINQPVDFDTAAMSPQRGYDAVPVHRTFPAKMSVKFLWRMAGE